MLSINSVPKLQARPLSFVTLLGSASLLLVCCTSAFAQSTADVAATRDWLKRKVQDPAVRASLMVPSAAGDPCDWQKKSFELNSCLEKSIRQWTAVAKVARADADASSTVKNTVQQIVDGLRVTQTQLRSLSPSEKKRQIAIRKEMALEVKICKQRRAWAAKDH